MIKKKILCFQEGEDLVPQVPGTGTRYWYGTGIKYQAQPQVPGSATRYRYILLVDLVVLHYYCTGTVPSLVSSLSRTGILRLKKLKLNVVVDTLYTLPCTEYNGATVDDISNYTHVG